MPRDRNNHSLACVRFASDVTAHDANFEGAACEWEQIHHRGSNHIVFWERFGTWCETCPESIKKSGGKDYWKNAQALLQIHKPNAV